ncbi:Cobalt-zinc-cadmium resistance protein CzcB [Thalassocella blandensis]|nr:Cobalt-zinc-cadmium resistance protein CzcB [Thalassocella blandensis]
MRSGMTLLTFLILYLSPMVFAHEANTMAEEEHSHRSHDESDTDDHAHNENGHENSEHSHEESNFSTIDTEIAQKVGLATSIAGTQNLHQTAKVYGSLAAGPEQLSHVRSRFEGLVKSVNVTIGDYVKAGDLLAQIESNTSLKDYDMLAPISGRVMQRHANKGEFTTDQVLFSIANFHTLWAELRIYPRRQQKVSQGQHVTINVNDREISSTVKHVIPVLDKPYLLARVLINNKDLSLSPGLLVEAYITTSEFEVPVAVSSKSLQTLDGKDGVFVKHENNYQFTPLKLGRNDNAFHEVLEGITPGTEYVSQNSYLLKADIEKSEAEHAH